MKSKSFLLLIVVIFVILVLLVVLYSYKKSEEIEIIDPSKYEKAEEKLLSKEICENDNFCKQEFNEYWECKEIDNNERCVCIITNENNPVCGVDGETYSNSRVADCMNMKIAYLGECIPITCVACGNNCIIMRGYYPTDRYRNPTTEDFECKIINEECKKVFSRSVCGNGICEEGEGE